MLLHKGRITIANLAFLAVLATAVVFVLSLYPGTAVASTGINQELSFEGKITSSTGTNITDGNYNVEFQIWNGASCNPSTGSGCTAVWTEDYLTSNGTYGTTVPVAFTSGTFQVNLGSICSLGGGSCEGNSNSAVNFNSYPLYVSINVGTTSVCSAGFSSCGGGTGVMYPLIALTSSPYSFNSNELGGLTSSQYGQIAANNVFTGNNTIQSATNSSTALQIQNADGESVLQAGTSSPTNYITDGDFANGSGSTLTDWTKVGSPGTYTQNTTASNTYEGNTSLEEVLAATNEGVETASSGGLTSNPTTNNGADEYYTVSFEAMGTLAANTFTVTGIDSTGNQTCTGQINGSGTTTLSSSGFEQVYCTLKFTSGSTGSISQIEIQNSSTTGTLYFDDVQLQLATSASTSATPTAYQEGSLDLRGVINNPVALQGTSNSQTAFQVQNASGNDVFDVDTLDGVVGLGSASGNVNGTLQFSDSGNTNTVSLLTGTASSTYNLVLPTSGPGTSQCLESGPSTASLLTFASCGGSNLEGDYNSSNGSAPTITLNNASNPALTIQNTNSSPISGTLFGIYSNTSSGLGSPLFTVASTGDAAINTTDTTGTGLTVTGSSITTGNVATFTTGSANTMTSGNLVNIATTDNVQSGAGSLLNVTDTATLTTNGSTDTASLVNVNRSLTADVTGGGGATPTVDTAGTGPETLNDPNGNSDTWSVSYNVSASHTNNFLLVELGTSSCSTYTFTVSYNSTNMTQIGCVTLSSISIIMFGLANPSTGANTLEVSTSTFIYAQMNVSDWYNVSQSSPYNATGNGSFTSNTGTTSTGTLSASSVPGQVIADAFYVDSDNTNIVATTASGQSRLSYYDDDSVNATELSASSIPAAGSGNTTTMGWSNLPNSPGGYMWQEASIGLNGASNGTESVTSPVVSLSNNCPITDGFCTDNTNVLSLDQAYSGATGAVLNVADSGSGSAINLTANNVTTGNGDSETFNGLTSGNGLQVATNSAIQSGSGSLLNVTDTALLTPYTGSDTGSLLNVSRSLNVNTGGSASPAFDAAGYFGGAEYATGSTTSLTVGNNSNRLLVVALSIPGCEGPADYITYAGVNMNLEDTVNVVPADEECVYIYDLTQPTIGANNLVVYMGGTIPNGFGGVVDSFYNVDQTSPIGSLSDNYGSNTSPTVNATPTSTGQEMVDFMSDDDDGSGCTGSPADTQAVYHCPDVSGGTMAAGSSYGAASSGTTTMSWSGIQAPDQDWNEIALALNGTTVDTVTAPVATISNSCTLTEGYCSDATNVLQLNQQYSGATGTVLDVQDSGSGDLLDLNTGSSPTLVTSINSNGGATFADDASAGSTTSFQIQNAVGEDVLDTDTTSTDPGGAIVNYLSYPGFEVASAGVPVGWTSVGSATLTQNTSHQHVYNGQDSASVATTATAAGLTTSSFTSAPAAHTYLVSFYVEPAAGTTIDGNQFTVKVTGTSSQTCTPSGSTALSTSGFTELYCQVAATSGTVTALQVTEGISGTNTFYFDGMQMQSTTYNGGTISTPTAYQMGGIQLRGVIENPVAIQNEVDSTSALQVINAEGTNTLLNADTLDSTVSLNSSNASANLLNLTNNSATTSNLEAINANALTSGNAISVVSTSSSLSTGALASLTDNSATTATSGLVQISGTGLTTGVGLMVKANTLSSGAAIKISSTASTATAGLYQIDGNSLSSGVGDYISDNTQTTGYGLEVVSTASTSLSAGGGLANFSTSSATTDTGGLVQIDGNNLTTGLGLIVKANALSSGAAIEISSTATAAVGGLQQIVGNNLTTGIGQYIPDNAQTTGYGLEVVSTASTSLSNGGGLANFSGASVTTSTSGLVQIKGSALTSGIGLIVTANSLSSGAAIEISSSASTATSGLEQTISNNITTGIAKYIPVNSLSSGYGLEIVSTGSSFSSGALALFSAATATTATGGLVQVNGSALTSGIGLIVTANSLSSGAAIEISSTKNTATGGLFQISGNSLTTGIGEYISANSLTTGYGLEVATTGSTTTGGLANFSAATATTATSGLVQINGSSLTTGIGLMVTANTLSSGAAIKISSTASTATAGLYQIDGNSLSSGVGDYISDNAQTTGYGLEVVSTSTTSIAAGGLAYFNASTATTATGGLIQINGSDLTTGLGLIVKANALSSGAAIEISSSATTATGGLSQIYGNNLTTGIGEHIADNAQTTGYGLEVVSTASTSLSNGGGLANFVDNSATTATGGLVQISGTALTTGVGLNINSGSGIALQIDSGAVLDLASSTAGNTAILKIPQLATTTDCATATSQGIIIENTGGTRVGHICINGPTASTAPGGLEYYATAFNAGDTDVAENYSDVDNNLSAGELVSLDPSGPTDAIVAATQATEQQMIGIVSTAPGILLSGINEDGSTNLTNPKPIALSGRVPTMVDTENGPISVGDYLTISSTPGVAMKATSAGMVIGRALEAYDGSGVGSITVIAQNSYNMVNNTINDNLNVNGTLLANGGLSVMGPANFYGESTFYKLVTFVDQAVFNENVTFNGQATFNNNTGGFAVIHKGQSQVAVTFTTPFTATPVVTVSNDDGQLDPYSYSFTDLTDSGFTIILQKPATQDMNFDWRALSISNATSTQVQTSTTQ